MADNLFLAIVMVSLIGGCTYTVTSSQKMAKMETCISANYEWIDGDCVKAKAP